jgi:hypothetical protein
MYEIWIPDANGRKLRVFRLVSFVSKLTRWPNRHIKTTAQFVAEAVHERSKK